MSGERRRLCCVALACAALGVVVPGVARAQVTPAAVTEQARRLFHQGITLADQDRWAEALAAFQQSLGLVPRASTRFNLARALLRLGRLREAIEVFDAYLAEAQGAGEAARVAEATRLRAEAVAALSTLRLVGLPEEAEVSVDGALLPGRGAPRVLRVDPGVRRVEVRDAAGHVERFTVTTIAAQVTEHSLSWPEPPPLLPRAEILVRPPDAPPPPPPSSRGWVSNPWVWVGAGAVVAGTAAVLLYVFRPTEAPYGGTTDTVIQGATAIRF